MSSGDFDSQTPQPDDEAAVRALYKQLMDAWNKGSGEAYAAQFAEDGDLIGFDGTHFKGRQEIAPLHQRLFETYLKGTRLVGQVASVRFLSPDVALMHAVGGTVMRGKSAPSPERDSIQTLVATKRGGEWRFAAFQNTRVRPIGRNCWNFRVDTFGLAMEGDSPKEVSALSISALPSKDRMSPFAGKISRVKGNDPSGTRPGASQLKGISLI